MIYITMHDYSTFEPIPRITHNGKVIRSTRIPHDIAIAIRNGESVMFDDALAGFQWFGECGRGLIHNEQSLDARRVLKYFGLKYLKQLTTVEMQCHDLPKLPLRAQLYMSIEHNYMGDRMPIPEPWIAQTVLWLAGTQRGLTYYIPLNCMFGGSGAFEGDFDESRVTLWRYENPSIVKFWKSVEIAAKAALDGLDRISVDVGRTYKLIFSGAQVRPGKGALTVETPSGNALWIPDVKLENGQLLRNGRTFSRTNLVKKIVEFVAWEALCEYQLRQIKAWAAPEWAREHHDNALRAWQPGQAAFFK